MYHHPSFVEDQGYLPWATEATYDTLKACFERRDWDKAVLVAADLGHYVADAHMPLHLTRNYNGQFTGNKGIHSRYESTMIGDYIDQIQFEGDSIHPIENVNKYIFDYIYHNYPYVDSVIAADDYASNHTGSTSSNAYTNSLWEKTRSFTIPLFRNASLALTELIYTAWIEAGKPYIDVTSVASLSRKGISLEQNYPNPFSHSTSIQFTLQNEADVILDVFDDSGRLVENILDSHCPSGETKLLWQPGNLSPGNYYLVLKSGKYKEVRTIILVD